MRLIQHQEEPASLSKWLGRDLPHERELMRETLQTMGSEKGLEALLHLHDVEETKRQKRLLRHYFVSSLFAAGMVGIVLVIDVGFLRNVFQHQHFPPSRPLVYSFLLLQSFFALRGLWGSNKRRNTPLFSTIIQQNVITALLNYGNDPLIADALARATTYHAGDRSRLYTRLAQILPLLPDDKEALTETARRTLLGRLNTPALVKPSETEAAALSLLHSAIIAYRARTEKSSGSESPRPLEKTLLKFYVGLISSGHRKQD